MTQESSIRDGMRMRIFPRVECSQKTCQIRGPQHRVHRRARPSWAAGSSCATVMLCSLLRSSHGFALDSRPSSRDGATAFMTTRTAVRAVPLSKPLGLCDASTTCSRGRYCCNGISTTARRVSKQHGELLDIDVASSEFADNPEENRVASHPQVGNGLGADATASYTALSATTASSSLLDSCGTTTRMDFIRQASMTALIISSAVASSMAIIPDPRSAIAAESTDLSDTSSGTATSSSTIQRPSPSRMTSEEDMIWLNEDSGTVTNRLSQVDETFCQGFVAYLARFLLNYDESCERYFRHKLDVVVPRLDGSETWEEFRGFVASVGFGLHRFQGANGARELGEALSLKYASGNPNDGSAGQLAMLFSLLPPRLQPLSTINSLLERSPYESTMTMKDGSIAPSLLEKSLMPEGLGVDLSSILQESPTNLLPNELRPMYDKDAKAFFVPGVSSLEKGGELLLVFGTRGPFPISKERKLTAADFGLFAACGALGCTATHVSVVPLDVVKTRLQTDPGRYAGLAQGVTTIAREEGWPMLLQGMGPTVTGYLWYGITVYPGYELFKRLFIELAGPLNAGLFRIPLVLAAGASATCFACIGVCPAEAVRIRQVADPMVGNFPSAVRQIISESGWGKLYEGLPSILFRQISFGMMKFLVFDFFSDFAYSVLPVLAEQTSTQLSVSLVSGLVAGVCAAIVSQPADTVMSVMNRDPGRATILGTIRGILSERGPSGLFLGLGGRIVWSGAIISGQFLLYDVCKTALHVASDDLRVFLDVIASAGL